MENITKIVKNSKVINSALGRIKGIIIVSTLSYGLQKQDY